MAVSMMRVVPDETNSEREGLVASGLSKGFRPFLSFAISLVLLLAVGAHDAEPQDAATDAKSKSKPSEIKKIELHKLSNDDLLKQAAATHDTAVGDYLAQLRAVAAAEMMLQGVKDAAAALMTPEKKDNPGDGKKADDKKADGKKPLDEEAVQSALDAAGMRLKLAKRALELAQAEAEWLRQMVARLEGARGAAIALQDALEDLKAYVLEIELRIKDATLATDKIALRPGTVEKKKLAVAESLAELKNKQEQAQKALADSAASQEAMAKALRSAEADQALAAKAFAREQKRASMEKSHAAKKPDVLLAELDQLRKDGIGLKGAYELANDRFQNRVKQAEALRKDLEALKTPEAKIPQLTRAEDLEVATKSIRELIAFYAARAKKIETLQAALTELVKQGQEFEADAAVSSDHLFKMVVLGGLLQKAAFPEEKLPEEVRPKRLAAAAERQAASASAVLSAAEKARLEMPLLQKQYEETQTASAAAAAQLDNLIKSGEATLAALRWEGQLKGMSGPQVIDAFAKTREQLKTTLEKLKSQEQTYDKARAAAAEARAKLEAVKDPFLRAAAEEGVGEKQKLLAEFSKEAGLERPVKNGAGAEPAKPTTEKKPPEKKSEPDKRSELEKTTEDLATFQQAVAARLHALEEQQTRRQALLAALKEQEDTGGQLAKILGDARALALEGNVTAVDVKKRVGNGELTADQIPDGVSESLRGELRGRLETTAANVLQALSQAQQLKENLSRPDPDGDALKTLSRDMLDLAGKRIDLIGDVKRLVAEYERDKSTLPVSEQKRLEQVVAERLDGEASRWDMLLGLAPSRSAKTLEELLESYYRELVEVEEKEANLKKQRDKLGQLIELTQKEEALLLKLMPLLSSHLSTLEALREEEALLARARLKPEQAQELLKTYQSRTGRLLPRPVPVGEKEKGEKVEELAAAVFERYVRAEAAKRWQALLAARFAANGKGGSGAYETELARVNTVSAANQRRISTLTGAEAPDPAMAANNTPAAAGEIGSARAELHEVRLAGIKVLGLKIGLVLVLALLLPWLVLSVIRFARRHRPGDSDLVYSAMRTFLRVGAWIIALVVILSLIGVDITAILAGLGIGGLAIGLAAQPMIADIIAAMVIFVERRFKIGDVIRLGDGEPARVVALSWRVTQVRNSDGVLINIPNRTVTRATLQNLTTQGRTYDSMTVTITTPGDVTKLLEVVRQAAAECKEIAPETSHAIREFTQTPTAKVMRYSFSWHLPDYQARARVRDEVFTRISQRLAAEEWKETEIKLE